MRSDDASGSSGEFASTTARQWEIRQPMKVAIVTSGRFHVGDLARELMALDVDVTLYSLIPPADVAKLGLPPSACRLLWPAGPAWALQRLISSPYSARLFSEMIDCVAAAMLKPCDAVIAMAGMSRATLTRARRFGARTFVDRSSKHIRAQKRIVDALPPNINRPSALPGFLVEREVKEYENADQVVVPAQHVFDSFLYEGFPRQRLFLNPFGTNLTQFYPTPSPPIDPPRIVMAGAWSYRKGVDVLVTAFEALRRRIPNAELHHVGPVFDAPLPRALPGFTHEDSVPQPELLARYARAHVFVLASREEGLAVVQAQALAAGLRLVCTHDTGGADLAELVGVPAHVVPANQPAPLADALEAALIATRQGRDDLGPWLERLSWKAYARRWRDHLDAVVPL